MAIKLFNNVLSYRLTQPLGEVDVDELSVRLGEHRSRPIASQELSTMGFVAPFGVDEEFAELIGGKAIFVSALKKERILPGKVVKQAVEAKVAEIEKGEVRKVYAKEKARIKDEIVQVMLPRAFVTSSRINALISPPYIFVEGTSVKKSEDLLSMLRQALGSLSVRPVCTRVSPIETFTDWVRSAGDRVPSGFSLGESFQSRGASEESSTLSGKNVTLSDDDIIQLVEAGRRINQIELIWGPERGPEAEGVPFTVNEMLGIKGIQWPEELYQVVRDDIGEDESKVTEARATLMLVQDLLCRLLADTLEALGGEEVPDEHPMAAYLNEFDAKIVDEEVTEDEDDLL